MEQEINEEMNPGKKARAFTGVWIIKEIYLAKGLSWFEKILYVEIESLTKKKGCFASNEYFAGFLNVSESTVSKAINRLITLELVELESFDGRKRTLKIASNTSEKLQGSLIKSIRQPNKINKVINKSVLDRNYSSKIRILEEVQAAPESPSSGKPLKSKPIILKRLAKRNNSKIVRDKFHNKEFPLPKEKAAPLFVPKSVQDIIDHWNGCSLRQHKDPTSKIYREIVKRVKLVLRNKFNMEEFNNEKITPKKILLAIDHFKLSATDLSYEPWNKDYLRKLSLFDFFYNIRSPRIKSQFIYCLDPPRPIDDLVAIDEHPEITEEFKKQYVNKVLGGVKTSEFTNREENYFKKTAKMMLVFFHKYGDRMTLTPIERKYPINLVEYIFAALDKRINEDWTQVTPGWFAQPSVYSKTLPAYLYNQAIIEEPINN